MEIWKDVVGYENEYQVSNLGRVRSKTVRYLSSDNRMMNRTGKIRALSKAKYYLKVNLKKRGHERTINVHVLVGEAFLGLRKEGEQYDHVDDNKLNNRADNLRIITWKQNNLRSVRGKSKYQGVWYRAANKNRPYIPHLMINGKRKAFGAYATEEEAYSVYKKELENHYPNGLKYFEEELHKTNNNRTFCN